MKGIRAPARQAGLAAVAEAVRVTRNVNSIAAKAIRATRNVDNIAAKAVRATRNVNSIAADANRPTRTADDIVAEANRPTRTADDIVAKSGGVTRKLAARNIRGQQANPLRLDNRDRALQPLPAHVHHGRDDALGSLA
ncbi:MAG TPA: hypothetical protein VH877_16835 [Polyangia bacterium]|nr:hypothetical protein [Polyangia bacterium]